MIHLAYMGIGLLAVFAVVGLPVSLSFIIDLVIWRMGVLKNLKRVSLSSDFLGMWVSGVLIIAMVSCVYFLGMGAVAGFHHFFK